MPEPVIDPTTGEPAVGTPNPDVGVTDPDFVPKSDFDALKGRLDAFEKGFSLGNQNIPPSPPPPSGPTLSDQVSAIDDSIGKLNKEIDLAVKNGEDISPFLSKRDNLTAKRLRLQIQSEDIDPLKQFGTQAIEYLSDSVTSQKMPHLPLVKDDMDRILGGLTPDQRANPQAREQAYNMAVGQNMNKIMDAQKEEWLRDNPQPLPDAPSQSGRDNDGDAGKAPKPEDVLSEAALYSLKQKGQSVDDYYKSLGYEGWQDHYEKNKEYYET
jgi:hypothetical protein